MIFKVALLQVVGADNDPQANLVKGEAACRSAESLGADLALFPEMWNINYSLGWERPFPWQEQAIDRGDAWFAHFRDLARELDMAIALTYLERWPGGPRNSLTVIDRRGRECLTHAKAHICDWGPEGAMTAGDAFLAANLDTAGGPVRIGAMICYDREFPESARLLMLQGAEVVLVSNSCEQEINRISQTRGQAWENMMAIALCTYPAPKNNGRSMAFDGVGVYAIDGPIRDTLIVEAGADEGIVIAEIDIGAIRKCRDREALGKPGGRYRRRPELYRALCSQEAQLAASD